MEKRLGLAADQRPLTNPMRLVPTEGVTISTEAGR